MKKKGIKTKSEIVKQSLQLFSQKGYYNTSIQDVMEATGLTKGGLYCHYAGKEAIWQACYQEAVTIWRSIVFRDVDTNQKAYDQLKKVLKNDLLDYLGKDTFKGGCFLFNMLIELSGQEEDLVATILYGFDRFEIRLAKMLRQAIEEGDLPRGLPVDKAAAQILIMVNGTAAIYTARHQKQLLHDSLEQILNYLRSFPDRFGSGG